jgi:uncharacterized membrane protein
VKAFPNLYGAGSLNSLPAEAAAWLNQNARFQFPLVFGASSCEIECSETDLPALKYARLSSHLARRSMFFGARVGPEFIASTCGDSILKRFRLRIWFLSLAIVFACILLFWRKSIGPEYVVKPMLFVFFVPMIGNLIMFGLANRETRREAVAPPGLSTRTAALFVEEESSAWLTVLDWLGILLPIGMPLATIAIVILRWHHLPQNDSPLTELRYLLQMGVFGIFPAGTYFALRFRARSSDWAPNPRASRRYRTLLGLMISGVFSFMIFKSCWLSLMPLLGSGPFGAMNTYFRYSLPASIGLILVLLGMRIYLRKNLARESSDPMPNRCWKWGYFYYNPADAALVVPSRSGTGFSFNHASRAVWFVGAIGIAVSLFVLLSFFLS